MSNSVAETAKEQAPLDWRKIVAWVGDLKPFPQVATQALILVEDPRVSTGKITKVLGQDTALAARVLKIANSAMFSFQREITTLSHAITIIGLKALKGIVVAATLRQYNKGKSPVERLVWENSTCTATAARVISSTLNKPYSDELFLAGLLHDLGKLVLMDKLSDEYRDVLELVAAGSNFSAVETEKFGFAHPLVGALVAKKWNFSDETCQIILHHHDPLPLPFEDVTAEKTAVIQFANYCAHMLGCGHPEGHEDVEEQFLAAGKSLGVEDQEQLDKILETVKVHHEEQSTLY